MHFSRRDFLKKAGAAAALGLAGGSAFELLEPGFLDAAEPYKHDYKAYVGKHWGMVVDLAKFNSEADIEPLVKACHNEHNVPDIPSKQNVKWIWGTGFDNAFPFKENNFQTEHVKEKPIVVLCNHCEDPPCVRVCPTKATFKREQDGIVMMDMHRCIGCRFCMAACPYGSRSFNFGDPRKWLPDPPPNPNYPTRAKGVVEKCNFCAERLAVGKIPACVEAAKDNALIFGDLADERSEIRKALRQNYSIRRKNYLGTGPSVYYLV